MSTNYDPEISKLATLCSQLAYEQYEQGLKNPDYDGSISQLPSFSKLPSGYKQILSLKSPQLDPTCLPQVKEAFDSLFNKKLSFEKPLYHFLAGKIKTQLEHKFLDKILPVRSDSECSVYFGFILQSDSMNILAFRGTTSVQDWVVDALAFQTDISIYIDDKTKYSSAKVHLGFILQYSYFQNSIRNALKDTGGKTPLLITGHSLGAALSAIACFLIATSKNGPFASKILNYNYASPRVGNEGFQEGFDALISESYRIVNFSDIIPQLPPSKLGKYSYKHCGTQYDYLFSKGDLNLNHDLFNNYQVAVDLNVPSNNPPLPDKPISCRC